MPSHYKAGKGNTLHAGPSSSKGGKTGSHVGSSSAPKSMSTKNRKSTSRMGGRSGDGTGVSPSTPQFSSVEPKRGNRGPF